MNIFRVRALFSPAGGDGGGSGAGGATGGEGTGAGQSGSGANGNSDGKSGGGDGGSSGSSGSANSKDVLFGDDKGGASGGAGSGDGKTTGEGGNNDPNKQTGDNNSSIVIPANWKDSLAPELKDDPTIKLTNTVGDMAKMLVNAQKMIGGDKIVIPGKHATTDDWKEAFHKLGNPRDIAEYQIEIDKETAPLVDKEFVEQFKVQAHKLGVLPRQAGEMIKWFGNLNKEAWSKTEAEHETKLVDGMKALEREWGTAFPEHLVRAKAAITTFADKNTTELMRNLGLGKNASFLKFMAKVGETLSEDQLRGAGGTGNFAGRLTPSQANDKIKEINSDPKHPYWNTAHENHKKAVKEMTGYFEMASPKKSS